MAELRIFQADSVATFFASLSRHIGEFWVGAYVRYDNLPLETRDHLHNPATYTLRAA